VSRLVLTGLAKRFGATVALRDVSLAVAAGEVHALIGENGAGKSTLTKILSGALRSDAGRMALEGQPFAPSGPLDALRRGVAMIYQEPTLAPHLTVAENVVLGTEPRRWGGRFDRAAARRETTTALAELGHGDLDPDRPAASLSVAERQLTEIARALRARPRVLILDEPTSSLGPADTGRLLAIVRRLGANGVSVIYISHFLEECRQVADRYTVLKDGATAGDGAMAAATVDHLVQLITGRRVGAVYPSSQHTPGAVVLEVRDLARPPRLHGAGFAVRAGEVFGLAGLVGAGRTELLRTLFGLDRATRGTVAVIDAPAGPATPRHRWRQGLGFLSEDRQGEGLLRGLSVAENLAFPKLGTFARGGVLRRPLLHAAAARWIEALAVKARGPAQPVGELSGGNQQKVALARLLEFPSRVLLLDEPTRGIDVGSKAQLYEQIARLAAAGRAVVLVSSYLPELLGVCDTIGAMCRGRLVAVRPRAAWTETSLLRAITGADEGEDPAEHSLAP
jgi:ribose transport system ATP-binding protein